MEIEQLVSSLFFPFLFTCGFWYQLTELKNTIFTPRMTPLQRQPVTERKVCLWHLSFPFCDLPVSPHWAAHVLQTRKGRTGQASTVFFFWAQAILQSISLLQGKTKNPPSSSIIMSEHRRNMNIVWTTKLMQTATYPGSFEWLLFLHQSWFEPCSFLPSFSIWIFKILNHKISHSSWQHPFVLAASFHPGSSQSRIKPCCLESAQGTKPKSCKPILTPPEKNPRCQGIVFFFGNNRLSFVQPQWCVVLGWMASTC